MPFPSCNIFAFQFKTSHILKKALCCCLQLTQSVQEKMQLFIPGLRFNVIEACHCIYIWVVLSVFPQDCGCSYVGGMKTKGKTRALSYFLLFPQNMLCGDGGV